MSKSKKHKKPNIPLSALARPRLDAVLDAAGQEPEVVAAQVATLVRELGIAPVLDSIVKRVESASPEEQERLRGLAARLRTDENVTHLWNLVKRQGGMSDDAKRAALIVLRGMGEEIALDDPSRYLAPPRAKTTSQPNPFQQGLGDLAASVPPFTGIEPDQEFTDYEQARIRDIIAQSAFKPPLEQFLYFDEPDEFDSRDYMQEGITQADIPELIRMATSRDLFLAPFPSSLVWARIHAWRALGQLKAVEAVAPLLTLLKYIDEDQDDWIGEDMPRIFGQIGPAALAPLGDYLADTSNPVWARVAAEDSIQNIAVNFTETRGQAINLLTRTLERYTENDPILNGDIIYGLSRLRATETLPVIEKVFAADLADETINGDWEDLQIQFGLKSKRSKPRRKTILDAFRLR